MNHLHLLSRIMDTLEYKPETGEFIRTKSQSRWLVGASAGCYSTSRNAVYIMIDGKTYSRGKLVWLFVTGELPTQSVRHRDKNPRNDRYENLYLHPVKKVSTPRPSKPKMIGDEIGMIGISGIKNGEQFNLLRFGTIKEALACADLIPKHRWG